MSKFKVGDRVISNDPQIINPRFKGFVGVIEEVYPQHISEAIYSIYFGGTTQTAYEDKDNLEFAEPQKENPSEIVSDGGPAGYYDFLPNWVTWNDLADYKAQRQWKEFSFHLGNIGKAIYRWGEKSGTSIEYDAKKIIYSGLRVLLMMTSKQEVRKYLEELSQDPQFKE
jgi:hypothetical protein